MVSILFRESNGKIKMNFKFKKVSKKCSVDTKGLNDVIEEPKQRTHEKSKAKLIRFHQRRNEYLQRKKYLAKTNKRDFTKRIETIKM